MQRCPECDESIDADAINIEEGFALCPKCGTLSRLSELTESDRSVQEILEQPPSGCSIDPLGNVVVVTASLRSIGGFLASAAAALFWNSIVSVFVLIAVAGLFTNLVGPLPAWFPAPGLEEGKPEMNGQPMGLGMTLFLCIFLIPFVTIGGGMVVAAMMNLIGRVEVVVNESDAYIATGIGLVKWKRRFDPHQVRSIRYGRTRWQSDGDSSKLIELAADRTLKFGSLLQPERMVWLQAVLRQMFRKGRDQRQASAACARPWRYQRTP